MGNRALLREKNLCIKRCRHGLMMFYTTDRYVGLSLDCYGEFSQGEMDLLANYISPGHHVCDLGAHVGAHTLFFSRAVGPEGRVYSFEPQRGLYYLLCGNLALNGIRNVLPQNSAVGEKIHYQLVPQLDFSIQDNFAGLSLSKESQGEAVPLIPLDCMEFRDYDLIKIDVEGMEKSVLQGAEQTIRRCKPVLYVENDRDDKSPELIEQLFSLDYRLFWHLPPLFNPENFFGKKENVFGGLISANMLCLHRSHRERIPSGLKEVRSGTETWRSAV